MLPKKLLPRIWLPVEALAPLGNGLSLMERPMPLSAMVLPAPVCVPPIVLACEPVVLVLDEPTSDLDPRGRREFKALLRQIPATTLIATHDLELVVELCSRAIVLDQGQVVADGPVVELLNNEELMLAHGLERPHILRHKHPH